MADSKGVWGDLSDSFKSSIKQDASPEPQDSSKLSKASGESTFLTTVPVIPRMSNIGISTQDFFLKLAILLVTLYGGMISGAFAMYKGEPWLFALAYGVPAILVAPLAGGILGALLWGAGAGLFGITDRGVGRALVLLGIHIAAIYLYLYQFSTPVAASWTHAFSQQNHFVIVLLCFGIYCAFPWVDFEKHFP